MNLKIKSILNNWVVDFSLRMAAILALAVGAYVGVQTRHLSSCQLAYNDFFNRRTQLITKAADQERTSQHAFNDAQAQLFLDPAVIKPAAERTPAENQRLNTEFNGWVVATQKLQQDEKASDAIRAQNPFPAPPSQMCKI